MPTVNELRHKITLETCTEVADSVGQLIQTWATSVANIPASIEPLSVSESTSANQMVATCTHRIQLRYRSPLTERMRFKFGTRVFNILEVKQLDERNFWIECLVAEVRTA